MRLFPTGKEKDQSLGDKFVRKFPRVIIGKDKNTSKFVLLFKSNNEAVLIVGTDQTEAQELDPEIK